MSGEQIGQVVLHKGKIIAWKVPIQVVRLEDNPEKGRFVYVADCPLLHVASHGNTEVEVRKSIKDVIQVFLDELLEMKTFDEVMVEYGWKRSLEKAGAVESEEVWIPPQVSFDYAMASA